MTVVAIPFVDRLDLTAPLALDLLADPAVALLQLWDNGSTDPAVLAWLADAARSPRVEVRHCPPLGAALPGGGEWSLYASWNGAWRRALEAGAPAVVLLNNDVSVPPGFVGALTSSLLAAADDVWCVYPRTGPEPARGEPGPLTRTRGLWPDGLAPFAFALRADARSRGLPWVDERFVFYCGDVDLLWQVQARGATCARAEHLTVAHRLGATRKDPVHARNAHVLAVRDRARRKAKYPHGPRLVAG